MLHNLKFTCSFVATYMFNCYICPVRLFVIGGGKLQSKEETNQGNPASIRPYVCYHCYHFFSILFPSTNSMLKWLPLQITSSWRVIKHQKCWSIYTQNVISIYVVDAPIFDKCHGSIIYGKIDISVQLPQKYVREILKTFIREKLLNPFL